MNRLKNNKNQYHLKLQPVIRYLEANFDQPLDLATVAEKANLSPYHFHRIFKAVVGETLNHYLRRLRLERAAHWLFFQQRSVTEVALDSGFSSSQSFAKAFKAHFGVTASMISQCDNIEDFTARLENSKIGQHIRKYHHVSSAPIGDDSHLQQTTEEKQMKTEKMNERRLAYLRLVGGYGENPQAMEQAVKTLQQWAGMQGLDSAALTVIFIYHDNPQITPAEHCRTDICLAIPATADISTSNGIELQTLPAGSYAVRRLTITNSPSSYAEAWDAMIAEVVDSDWTLADRPCFELYHRYDEETATADVSICVAIQ